MKGLSPTGLQGRKRSDSIVQYPSPKNEYVSLISSLSTAKWEVDVGPQASCMAASPSVSLQVATGRRENPMKLWDGHHTTAPLFTAKNVKSTNFTSTL